MLLTEEILDYDEDGTPIEKVEISVVGDDISIKHLYRSRMEVGVSSEWRASYDEGSLVPIETFMDAADKFRSL